MEASLLDSDVQELLGTEDLGAHGLTSNTPAAQTEFWCVVGLFELNCRAIAVTAVGSGGLFLQCLQELLLDWANGRMYAGFSSHGTPNEKWKVR